jgi:hypothetical protein
MRRAGALVATASHSVHNGKSAIGTLKRAGAAFSLSATMSVMPLQAAAHDVNGAQRVPKDEVAEVTGYDRASIAFGSSGPVIVELKGYREVSLAAKVDGLPSRPPIDCHEDVVLYQILFKPSPGSPANYQAVGHGCEAAVLVGQNAARLIPRDDHHCELFDAVSAVLPSSATGTLDGDASCKAPAEPPDGTITGELVREGGPPAARQAPVPGLVTLTPIGQDLSYLASADPNGAFRASVPSGTYSITGTSPNVLSNGQEMLCRAAQNVTVRARHKTLGVPVICNIK